MTELSNQKADEKKIIRTRGHGNLCGRFDLVYDPKRSQGH